MEGRIKVTAKADENIEQGRGRSRMGKSAWERRRRNRRGMNRGRERKRRDDLRAGREADL